MTTDTALGVTKRVIADRGSLVPHLSFPQWPAHCISPGVLLLVPLEEIPYVVRLSHAHAHTGAAADADIRR